jgi:hypothetical protein
MSKYGQLIKEARKHSDQKSPKPDTDSKANSEPDVNLSIKVAAARRRHWAAEAKRKGTTLTAAITDALRAKFGEPE